MGHPLQSTTRATTSRMKPLTQKRNHLVISEKKGKQGRFIGVLGLIVSKLIFLDLKMFLQFECKKSKHLYVQLKVRNDIFDRLT